MAQLSDHEEAPAVLVGAASVAQARVAAAAVEDFAGQDLVLDEPETEGADAVADGVGDQLTDDQFRGGHEVVQPPFAELPGGHVPGGTDDGRIGGEVP